MNDKEKCNLQKLEKGEIIIYNKEITSVYNWLNEVINDRKCIECIKYVVCSVLKAIERTPPSSFYSYENIVREVKKKWIRQEEILH